MNEPILCLAALALLGWVVILKSEIKNLKKENHKLRVKLKLGVHEMTDGVEVTRGKRFWGKRDEHLANIHV